MKKILIAVVLASSLGTTAFAALPAPALLNGSFETANIPPNGYRYAGGALFADPWEFSGGAGVAAGRGVAQVNDAWGAVAADGANFAFLQNLSSVSQTFASAGEASYGFSFQLALRPGYATGQVVSVAFDAIQIGTFTPTTNGSRTNTAWQTATLTVPNVGAGTHTLSFAGITDNLGDTTAFLDNVQMTVTPVPEPHPYAMTIAGLGLVGFVGRRRSRKAA